MIENSTLRLTAPSLQLFILQLRSMRQPTLLETPERLVCGLEDLSAVGKVSG